MALFRLAELAVAEDRWNGEADFVRVVRQGFTLLSPGFRSIGERLRFAWPRAVRQVRRFGALHAVVVAKYCIT